MLINLNFSLSIIFIIITILYIIIFYITKNSTIKYFTILFYIGAFINFILFLNKHFKLVNYAKNIINSTKKQNWANDYKLQYDTNKKCIPFMNTKFPNESNNMYNISRFNSLQKKISNPNKEIKDKAKDHMYYSAISCLNLAKMNNKKN